MYIVDIHIGRLGGIASLILMTLRVFHHLNLGINDIEGSEGLQVSMQRVTILSHYSMGGTPRSSIYLGKSAWALLLFVCLSCEQTISGTFFCTVVAACIIL